MTGAVTAVLMRHASTLLNDLDHFQGQCDPELTPRGVQEAADAARHLAHTGWSALLTSPQVRARQTYAAIRTVSGTRPADIVAALAERDLGEWDTRCRRCVELSRPGALEQLQSDRTFRPPGGESLQCVADRALPALYDALSHVESDEPVLAVTHGGVINAVRTHLAAGPHVAATRPTHALVLRVRQMGAVSEATVVADDVAPEQVPRVLDRLTAVSA